MLRRDRLYIVCYDISGDGFEGRLRKVYRVMRGFGDHIQYSMFRCALNDVRLAKMEAALQEVIRPTTDQVVIVPLGYADAEGAWQAWTLGVPIGDPTRVVRIA
jgi:CRISPR-associated protein Cas2